MSVPRHGGKRVLSVPGAWREAWMADYAMKKRRILLARRVTFETGKAPAGPEDGAAGVCMMRGGSPACIGRLMRSGRTRGRIKKGR